jgi:hypothetical protein
MLAGVSERVIVCGHTHAQFDRYVGNDRVVNAGSVGLQFGERGAYWALLGPRVDLRRTDYDYDDALARILAKPGPVADKVRRAGASAASRNHRSRAVGRCVKNGSDGTRPS